MYTLHLPGSSSLLRGPVTWDHCDPLKTLTIQRRRGFPAPTSCFSLVRRLGEIANYDSIFGRESVHTNHCQPTCLDPPISLDTPHLEDHSFDGDAGGGYGWLLFRLQC